MPAHRVRLIDIARKLNLSVSAVSQALREGTRISPATRKAVEETARELGYTPDPVLSALSAYRAAVARPSYNGNLALVSTYLPFQDWLNFTWAKEIYGGITERAEKLGYKIDYFYSDHDDKSQSELAKMLAARGIQGLIVMPDILHGKVITTHWNDFAVVHIFGNPYLHATHCVASNHYAEMTLVLEQLQKRKYQRPGFFVVQQISETSERDWLGSYLAHQDLFARWEASCISIVRGGTPEYTIKKFQSWLRQIKPDVLIDGGTISYKWLQEIGYNIPASMGYVTLDGEGQPEEVSGIRQSVRAIGVAAVNQVVSMVHRSEVGPVQDPNSILVHGKWTEGKTLRPLVG